MHPLVHLAIEDPQDPLVQLVIQVAEETEGVQDLMERMEYMVLKVILAIKVLLVGMVLTVIGVSLDLRAGQAGLVQQVLKDPVELTVVVQVQPVLQVLLATTGQMDEPA